MSKFLWISVESANVSYKVLERLVLARLRPHLTNSANFSKRQSAYRQGHSTETALIDVLESVYTAADNKEITVLTGLDLSAAFDTVCHLTLTQRLQTRFWRVGDCHIMDPVVFARSDAVC